MASPTDRSSRIISKVLSPAIQLWLRSQVESVEVLSFQIEGGDRQILSGCIPKVAIAGRKAVYQGLHLSQVDVVGEMIRINLGQVLKGKPLKLLEVVPIQGYLLLHEADLNASLGAPLLRNALTEFFLNWLRASAEPELKIILQEPLELRSTLATIQARQLTLQMEWRSLQYSQLSTTLKTGLSLSSSCCLKLEQPHLVVQTHQTQSSTLLSDYEVELGTDVELQELHLEPGTLVGRGQINVQP